MLAAWARRGADFGAEPRPVNDPFIAGHAQALGLTLVADNMAEFERVRGLVIENWTAATASSSPSLPDECTSDSSRPFP
jgi:predicted nucleic acid-binding protein